MATRCDGINLVRLFILVATVSAMALFAGCCSPGFTGSACETNIDECASNPCTGPFAQSCVDGINGYTCNCIKPYYVGENCTKGLVSNITSTASNCKYAGYSQFAIWI